MSKKGETWPALRLDQWQDTYETVHMWTQIIGKIQLSRMPWINHSWHVALHPTATGLTTSLIPHGDRSFEIEMDLIHHRLVTATSRGENRSFDLEPMSVADFYNKTMGLLRELKLDVHIWPVPVEIPGADRPFPENVTQGSYDLESVERFFRVLVQVHRVFTDFRSRFLGKVSPVHFFWGAFDLAVTRFSGRRAPKHPGGAPNLADWVMQEAYSHEVSSAGFWPGAGLGEPAFYSYAYPEPDGFGARRVKPQEAFYSKEMGEFILPYAAVRKADDPEAVLLDFLQSTYEAAADLADWDRGALERRKDPGS